MYATSRSTIEAAKVYRAAQRTLARHRTRTGRWSRRTSAVTWRRILVAALVVLVSVAVAATAAAAIPDPSAPSPPENWMGPCTSDGWETTPLTLGAVCEMVDAIWTVMLRLPFKAPAHVF